MPYYIRKLPNKDLYRVINTEKPGKRYSRDGQPKRLAIQQMMILAAAEENEVSTHIPKKPKKVPTRARYVKGSPEAHEAMKRLTEAKRLKRLSQSAPPHPEPSS